MNNIGMMYLLGHGTTRNYAAAMRWFRKAAALGNNPAMFSIAGLYLRGLGVVSDAARALRWYQKAAASGNPAAQRLLLQLQAR